MRKALIVWGGWPGHEPEAGAQYVARVLAEEGFTPEVTADFAAIGRPDLGDFSLFVPVITSAEIDREPILNLVAAVRAGLGFATFHGGATAFREQINYHFMMGAQWVQHPGDMAPRYTVHVEKPYDPVLAGIADFEVQSEQYYLHVDPTLDVLATTMFSGDFDPAATAVKMPVVYKRQFGAGRVFYSSLGHVPSEFETYPAAATILRRGMLWAAR